jgi:hypothetical protein
LRCTLFRGVSALCMGVLLSSGCLGPQASDDLPVTATSYPTAESVPRLESVPALEQKLLKSQGFKGTIIPLRTGFFGGEQVSYWDFGQGTTLVAPVYMLVTDVADDGSDFTPLPNHPVLFGVIPGQFGYTPLWQLVLVPITSAYNQEQITSIGAIQAAREQGLLGASITLSIAVDCPIVHRDSRLEERNGERAPTEAYWEGYRVSYFNLGTTDIEANGASGSEEAYYTLRREGGEPLDEAVRGVDMNGDGDLFDSNHVFNSLPGEPTYTPMVVATEVVVTRDTASVDTPDVEPDVKGHADLFDPDDGLPLTSRDRGLPRHRASLSTPGRARGRRQRRGDRRHPRRGHDRRHRRRGHDRGIVRGRRTGAHSGRSHHRRHRAGAHPGRSHHRRHRAGANITRRGDR